MKKSMHRDQNKHSGKEEIVEKVEDDAGRANAASVVGDHGVPDDEDDAG